MTTDTIEDVAASEDAADVADEKLPKKDYSVYPRHLRAHHKRLDIAQHSLEVLEKRRTAKREAYEKIEAEFTERARPLQETVIRAKLALAAADEQEARVQEALAKLDAAQVEDAQVDATE